MDLLALIKGGERRERNLTSDVSRRLTGAWQGRSGLSFKAVDTQMSAEMSSSPRFLPLPAALSMNISLIWPPFFFFFSSAELHSHIPALSNSSRPIRHVAVWLFCSDPVKKANRLRMDLIGAHRCFKWRSALRCSALYFSRKLLEHGGLLAHSEERAGTVTRHILRRKKASCLRLHFKPDFISGTKTMAPTRSLAPTGRQKRWFWLLESLSAWIYL